MTMTLDKEPLFAPAAQETFTPGDRIYAVEDTIDVRAGSEGTYRGAFAGQAAVHWDTPSGTPRPEAVSFAAIRQLYR